MQPIYRNIVSIVFLFIPQLPLLGASPVELPATEASSVERRIRGTVERALPYLEKQGVWWIEEKKCVTCHRVSFQIWSFAAAARKGFAVDEAKVYEWLDWSFEKSLASTEEGTAVDGAKNMDGVAQMILARAANVDPTRHQAEYAEFARLLVDGQQSEGFWKAAGQLPAQKRPKVETDQVTTMWIALALGTLPENENAQQSRGRAIKWLESAESGESVEWYAVNLLLAQQQGDTEKTQAAVDKLLSLQNEDGSWSWLIGESGDALATGQSLYALGVVGSPETRSAIRRGQAFLVDTQSDDGSWAVWGTKANKRENIEETATYWGTGWATLGLLKTIE
jgi:hypothetical protein